MQNTYLAEAIKTALATNAYSDKYRAPNTRDMGFLGEFMGFQVEPNRNLICQYGYPETPSFNDYYAMYIRVAPAKAIIDKPVNMTWQDWPIIRDATDFDANGEPIPVDPKKPKTMFEAALSELLKNRKLALKERIQCLDRKQRVGRYAGSLIVARTMGNTDPKTPLTGLVRGSLVKLVPLYESQLKVTEWNQDLSSPEYGEPAMYQVTELATGSQDAGKNRSFMCHPNRIIIAAEGAEDGSIEGRSAIQSCFYALMDWEKIRMSSAEGSKKNADQRAIMALKDGASLPTGKVAETMDENIAEWDNGETSTLLVSSADVKPFNANMGDPTKTAELCEKEMSAASGMPSTEIFGYQTGRLASEKDGDNMANMIMARRESTGTEILLDHIDRFIELGILPYPDGEIVIEWPDAREPSLKDKLGMIEQMSNINEKQWRSSGEVVFDADEMRELANYSIDDMPEIDEKNEDDIIED